jgi:hypothetical protein
MWTPSPARIQGRSGTNDFCDRAIRAIEVLPARPIGVLHVTNESGARGEHCSTRRIEIVDPESDHRTTRGEEGVEPVSRSVKLQNRAVFELEPDQVIALPRDWHAHHVRNRATISSNRSLRIPTKPTPRTVILDFLDPRFLYGPHGLRITNVSSSLTSKTSPTLHHSAPFSS